MSIVVFLQEEYGYREWVWMPDMSADELKAWWKAIPTVAPYFYDGPVNFPGEIHQIYFDTGDEGGFWVVKEEDRRVVTPISEKFTMNYDQHWQAHIHTDNDSYLKPPGEDAILHAGHVTDEEYYNDDYQASPEVDEAWSASTHEQYKKIMHP